MKQNQNKQTFASAEELKSFLDGFFYASEERMNLKKSAYTLKPYISKMPQAHEYPVYLKHGPELYLRGEVVKGRGRGSIFNLQEAAVDVETALNLWVAGRPETDGKVIPVEISYYYQSVNPPKERPAKQEVAKAQPVKKPLPANKTNVKPKTQALEGFVILHSEADLNDWVRRRVLGNLIKVNNIPRDKQSAFKNQPAVQRALSLPIVYNGRKPQDYPVMICKDIRLGYFGEEFGKHILIEVMPEQRLPLSSVSSETLVDRNKWIVGEIYYAYPSTLLNALNALPKATVQPKKAQSKKPANRQDRREKAKVTPALTENALDKALNEALTEELTKGEIIKATGDSEATQPPSEGGSGHQDLTITVDESPLLEVQEEALASDESYSLPA